MKPDGTDSLSAASESKSTPLGIHLPGPDKQADPVVKLYHQPKESPWTYFFVHHTKTRGYEAQLTRDGKSFFIHKTIRYYRRSGHHKVQHQEAPTVSGLIFIQGQPADTQTYLKEKFPQTYLCKDCCSGQVAVIPDAQMQPFMRINSADPSRIRFLLHPFHYYARNRILLRITTGELAGLEGYVIRIDRDRRLVMDVGGMSVAISGVHAERFEEVAPAQEPVSQHSPLYRRNLHERQVLIDRYFHPVKTTEDIQAQAENITFLHQHVLTELAQNRMRISEAWSTLTFIIQEIVYYYASAREQQPNRMAPIFLQGRQVLQQLDTLLCTSPLDADTRMRYETESQELTLKYDYLF